MFATFCFVLCFAANFLKVTGCLGSCVYVVRLLPGQRIVSVCTVSNIELASYRKTTRFLETSRPSLLLPHLPYQQGNLMDVIGVIAYTVFTKRKRVLVTTTKIGVTNFVRRAYIHGCLKRENKQFLCIKLAGDCKGLIPNS
jgi:hypothetical protein